MSAITHYFSIGAGSPLWAEIAEFRRLDQKQSRIRKAIRKELCKPRTDGRKELLYVHGHGGLVGIRVRDKKGRSPAGDFKGLGRPGWRWNRSDQINVPDKRTPEGRAIAARLRDAPGNLNWMNISQRLFKHDWVMSGMKTYFAVIEYKAKGNVAGVFMADCVLKKVKPALLKTYRLKEITATAFLDMLGLKAA